MTMPWVPDEGRYDGRMLYRRCGASGLQLPAVSLGLWHNFGGDTPHETKRAICRTAFDAGITHFDLANNYGPPPGSAEAAFGEILRTDLAGHRDELVISTKAGYLMWPGPYGEWGSRKYLLASLDASLERMGLDYVDIFYSHRFDPDTPLEETMGALDAAVRSGRALYAGLSSYNSAKTREAAAILKELGTPCLIHQPSYNMINRWVERDGLKETLRELGIGSIAFTPLAQGMLTGKYLGGIPEGSRATQGKSLRREFLNDRAIANIRKLNEIAEARGQTLAQMAIAWVLREGGITSALIGASRPSQVEDCVGAVRNLDFTAAELAEIDRYANEEDINLWARSSEPG
jgi:L-glyceraldehyde 3-phosphate reductase